MEPTYNTIHPRFRFNGHSFSKTALKEVAYSLIKEGVDYEKEIGDFFLDWLDSSHSIMVRTSGSTGAPKTIPIKKQQMVQSALATGGFFGLNPGDKVLHCLPSDFIAGKMMWVRAMVLGLEIDSVQPSTMPDISRLYDFSAMIPLQLENTLSNIDKIKTVIIGGASMSSDLKTKVQEKSSCIYETYGMTETITHIAAKKINHHNQGSSNFKTLPGVHISKDHRDCLIIDAPRVANAPIVTNDIVELVSDTLFVWKGRYDNIINSGGVKLIPEEIETLLSPLIKTPFFVTGCPDKSLGQRLILFVEGDFDKNELIERIKQSPVLDKFQKPKDIIGLLSFSRTPNGKIQRKKTMETSKEYRSLIQK